MTEQELLEKYKDKRQPCEVWTRVMGYFRPYSGFNIGKQSEFKERVWFNPNVAEHSQESPQQLSA